jgi:hypothetical protein
VCDRATGGEYNAIHKREILILATLGQGLLGVSCLCATRSDFYNRAEAAFTVDRFYYMSIHQFSPANKRQSELRCVDIPNTKPIFASRRPEDTEGALNFYSLRWKLVSPSPMYSLYEKRLSRDDDPAMQSAARTKLLMLNPHNMSHASVFTFTHRTLNMGPSASFD